MLVTFFFSLSINEQEKKMKKKQQVKLPELPSSSPPSGSGKAEGVNGDRGDKAEPLVSGRALCFLVSTLTLASRLVQKHDCVCEGCYLPLPTSLPLYQVNPVVSNKGGRLLRS